MTNVGLWINRNLSLLRVPTIRVTDLLEVLILAFLIYRILVWIKKTRAWTLLKGLITIVVCVMIVYALQMDTLIYIIERALSIVIITLVVVFQPELRRVLEQLGERNFLASFFPMVAQDGGESLFGDRTLGELVKGTVEMAKARTGALIVIMQKETLEAYERTGIPVDAVVSSQLLINIFEHNTPLHDGAVIIKGDRITAATCYLPLSDNRELSKELGTRHRAGVGISEVTDSFTIIVSEETGAISIAYKAELERAVTPERLRERLTILQNKSSGQNKWIWPWKGRVKNEK